MSAMVGPSPIFKVSRDTTRKNFFVASSPRRKAFPVLDMGRLLHPNLLNICTVRTEIHTNNFSLSLSRVRTPVLAGFSRACIVLFPWELELASHGFRTRLSPEESVRTLRSTHVPRSHIFFNFLFTGESDTPYPKSRTRPPRYMRSLSASYYCGEFQMLGAYSVLTPVAGCLDVIHP